MNDYIPINLAADMAAGDSKIEVGREAVLGAIVSGLVHARAFRAKVTELKFADEASQEIRELLEKEGSIRPVSHQWLRAEGPRSELEGFRTFAGTDAMIFRRATDETDWASFEGGNGFRREFRCDWKLGNFNHCSLYYHDAWYSGEDEKGFSFNRYDFFGVEVEKEAVERLLVPKVATRNLDSIRGVESSPVATLYDWEAAFADVAAAFYFDVEFDNVAGRGAQAEIVRLLRTSFAQRGQKEPGETILKAKARKLQAALRSHKS